MLIAHGLLSFLTLSATVPIYIVSRHQASPELTGSYVSVPMAFTTEYPPAQSVAYSGNDVGQYM